MSASKSQNSIIALATLGVYLGLLLAGATPGVLAQQAALTKEFNIKDEIERKDDLDKKPDDCEKLAAKAKEKLRRFSIDEKTFFAYSTAFTELTTSLTQLKTSPFSLRGYTYGDVGLPSGVSFWGGGGKPALVSGKVRRKLDGNILALARLFPAANIDGKEGFQFELSFDDNGLFTTAKVLRNNNVEAHQAFIAYDSLTDLWRCTPKNAVDILISKNTEITWENNQVIIVTRLPRGSLDTLLATNAK